MENTEPQTQANVATQNNSTPRSLHTPGPWQLSACSPETSEGASYALTVVVETNEEHIAFCFNDASANANLIAAAPELLAMCKELREVAAACFRVIDREGQSAVDDLQDEMRATGIADGFGKRAQLLIAKAEGAPSVPDALESDAASSNPK